MLDFDFGLGEDIAMLRETLRSFAQSELAPIADEIDRTNQFPRHLWPRLGDLGLHGLTVETEWGGTGLGYLAHVVFKLLSVAVISMCLAVGCAAQKMEVKQNSGFLGDYSKLQEGPEGGVAERYIKSGVDFKQYYKIMMDQVRFYFKDDAADKGIDADDMKELADTFHRAVIEALGDAYPLVAKPGPNVMRLRVAITEMELPNRGINAISTVLPVGLRNQHHKEWSDRKRHGMR